MKTKPFLWLSLLLLALWGCGSQPPAQRPQSASITISPASAVVGSPRPDAVHHGIKLPGCANSRQAVWSSNRGQTPLATTLVSSTQTGGVVPANLLINPVTAQLFVQRGRQTGVTCHLPEVAPFLRSTRVNQFGNRCERSVWRLS